MKICKLVVAIGAQLGIGHELLKSSSFRLPPVGVVCSLHAYQRKACNKLRSAEKIIFGHEMEVKIEKKNYNVFFSFSGFR